MVLIKIEGQDIFLINDYGEGITHLFSSILNIPKEEINIIANNSFFIHDGHEQTSYVLHIHLYLPRNLKVDLSDYEDEIKKCFQEFSIHQVITVSYFDKQYEFFDEEYPEYITYENAVKPSDFYINDDTEITSDDEYDEDYDDEEFPDQNLNEFLTNIGVDEHPEHHSHHEQEHECCCGHHHHHHELEHECCCGHHSEHKTKDKQPMHHPKGNCCCNKEPKPKK